MQCDVNIDVADWGYLINSVEKESQRDRIVEDAILEIRNHPRFTEIAEAYQELYEGLIGDTDERIQIAYDIEHRGRERVFNEVVGTESRYFNGCNFDLSITPIED